MSNLRIVSVTINSSTQITTNFTEALTPNLTTANVTITSATAGVGDSQVLSVAITSSYLTVTCQPLVPFAAYYITFLSTPEFPFESLNGNAILPQNGVTNTYLFTGPIEPDNPVKNYFVQFFNGNIYATGDETSIISQYIDSLAVNLARCLYDIRQCQNENYLSFQVVDEQQFRGGGPYDRLYNEGVYEVMRVGLAPTGANATLTLTFNDFPGFPVTLQQQANQQILTPSSNNNAGTININSLVLNLSNSPVTMVSSIVFIQNTVNSVYTYDIQTLGYQLLNSTFDQNYASTYELLLPNQVKLNTQILNDPLFDINQIVNVTVIYQSQDLGRNVDPNSIDIYTTMTSVREVLPPIENIFTLQHAPITDGSNNIPVTGGVSFLNPNSNTGAPHPAFLTEIPFSLSAPPSMPGVYSINYNTGTVYVYGASISNDGTGPYPPLATYDYRYTYVNESDYAYDVDSLELVALPLGNLINNAAVVTYNYEEVLVPGVDYQADTHIESINEFVQNRLVSLNSITTLNSPITNVFQIYNQSSGEIYTLQRWTNNNQIYFSYNTPPNIQQETGERATFQTVSGELLFINSITLNINSVRIFTIYLTNNTIIDSSEDGIGSSIDSSMSFNSHGIFLLERWYNQELPVLTNVNRILNPGDYIVDYVNGIIYLGVSNTQSNSIGSVNYKMNNIIPEFPHLISVDDIYYRISPLSPKNKHFSYLSFADGSIVPEGLGPSDEGFLNGNIGAPYQLYQGQVGSFVTGTFVAGVTNQVKSVRGLFEYSDLLYNAYPLNFAPASTSNTFNISVGSLTGSSFENIQFNGANYYVNIAQNITYLSPNITYNYSVVRVSDGAQLWNSSGVVVPGSPITLVLPDINSPQVGELVTVTFTYTIQSLSRIIVDYNKGDFFVDYTYLADEIVVSYEYGDNVIDFSQSNAVQQGDSYYVTYRAGALRDALVKNFGSLVDLPQLDTLDVNFPRERYRDALVAALSSFLQGPTVAAIKNIGQTISHIEPQVIESAFQTWSLGQSILYPDPVATTGSFQLLPAHFGNGVLVDQPGQTISLPVNSNCRFEEGTFEQWIIPQWNGLDNDATLNFNIMRSGVPINQYRIFIGGSEYHPAVVNGCFQLDKNANVTGKPNTNKDGVFIWYGPDFSGNYNRWYMQIIDGYVAPVAPTYKIKITSDGRFYDTKSFNMPVPHNATIFTGLNTLNISITTNNTPISEGITFVSDLEHFFLDLGKTKDRSRLSIFKDVSGYLNFRVWDRNKTMYSISSDVSNWKVGQVHQIAASWKLSTENSRDEMHLFVDGLEVPNIIKYGQKLQPYLHEKFRTVDPEEVVGLVDRDIVGSHDLTTIAGSLNVSSSINFSQFNIFVGDTIFINEVGFSPTGYQITNIDGQTLSLNVPMPFSLNADGNFSVNQTSFVVLTDIDTAPNITVSTISPFVTGDDLSTVVDSNLVTSISTNFAQQGVMPGFSIRIDSNSPVLAYTILRVQGNTLIINGKFPVSQTDISFQVYSNVETELPGVRALYPDYSISQNNNYQNILTVTNGVYADDLVLIRTLGINSRNVTKQYYIWSNQMENILMTQLPPPISLNETNITRIITPVTAVGPANSTVIGGIFYSDQILTASPSDPINGRTIQATIAGTNVNFSMPVQVTLNGVVGGSTVDETITFDDFGTLNFANQFTQLNYVVVVVQPINPAQGALTVELQEEYPITYNESDGYVPVVRYS
jgi:hypothetical protein